jgi:Arm DNA-binding domain/Phage integrase SAM-like domain
MLRTRSTYTGGSAPIYMRLTVDGQRFEVATQREIDPQKWDNKAGRAVRSKKEETRELNNYLDILQSKVFDAQRDLVSKGVEITAGRIRNLLLGENDDKKTLLDVFRQHVKEEKELVGKDYAEGTLRRFKSSLASLEAYLTHNGKADILLRELNHPFIQGMKFS